MKQDIKNIIKEAIESLCPDSAHINFSVSNVEARFGDYATNVAMILAKELGDKPIAVAQSLCDALGENKEIFENVSVAGPGFINFKIALPYFQQQILLVNKNGDKFGHSDLGKDLKVNIEFISANPTGPLTLGNGRNAYAGDALAKIMKAYGAKVEREYYVNDRGVQIIALGHSLLKDAEAVYKGAYIDEIVPQIKETEPAKVGEMAATIIMEEYIKKTIAKMGVEFDAWFSEKSLHDSGEVAKALGELENLGLVYKKEDATWLRTTDFGDDKDRVIVTSLGEYTYFASDIAYHFNKIRRGYDLLIDFWGADHHGYIGRLQAAMDMYRKDLNWSGELKVMICQLVRLMSNGQEVKMSKRAGNYVLIDELIDEVGPDVTRFFFLDRTLDTHMDFDLDLAKEKSDKNPVYYIQYAYARINSILEKAKIDLAEVDLSVLTDPTEIALIKEIIKLPELVEEIVVNYQVQKLAFYARDLATSFHHFYEKCSVLKADAKVAAARIKLLEATKIGLKNTLDLLGVSTPEKM